MKKLFYRILTIFFLTASLASCGPDGGEYGYDNPHDPVYNDQPETTFINLSSPSKRREKAEKNPVTLIWDGLDNDGNIVDYSYKMDDDEWLWTSDLFIEYTSLETGSHAFYVKARDNAGATDLTPVEITFEVDATPPSVSFTTPKHNASGVAVNSAIAAVFTEPLDGSTLISSTFEIKDGSGTPVPGIIDYTYTSATFTPSVDLDTTSNYTATVKTGVTDEVGNEMTSDYSWSFTTGIGSDGIDPEVSSTNPKRDAVDVPVNMAIAVTYSEPMLPFAITTSIFILVDESFAKVSGDVFHADRTATFVPSFDLYTGKIYTATIKSGAQDLAGNNLATDYSWTFTTGDTPETIPPSVSSTAPENGLADVSINSALTATFSEQMDPSTISTASFTLVDNSSASLVAGTVSYNVTTATFEPLSYLTVNWSYTAKLITTARDSAGNPLESEYSWSFTTGVESDFEHPSVSSTSPKNNATGVYVNSAITATFDEPMDASSLTTLTFLIEDSFLVPVDGAVTYSGTTATFMPYTLLDFTTSYTATIASDVTDTAGNNLPLAYSWNFETGEEIDNSPPAVMWTSPFDSATGVDIESVVTATFSEAVDSSTVTTSTFKLKDSSNNPVSGNVYLSSTTAIFTPYTSLLEGEDYTVKITTGVKDSAGNSLAEDYYWSFTTGYLPDIIFPSVSSIYPSDLVTNVPYDTSIIVTFSEPMDGSTITTDNIILDDEFGNIEGNVYYDGNVTAIFTPFATLAYFIDHYITVTTGVKDVAGNPMSADFTSEFTTVDAPDNTSPTVAFTNPSTGELNVPIKDPYIFITFSEPMDGSTISTDSITMINEDSSATIDGNVYFDGVLTALFKPVGNLSYGTNYKITVKSGDTGVKDASNNNNPLENPDHVLRFSTGAIPINVASSIAAGRFHSLAIKDENTWAWGWNGGGQLGNNTVTESENPVPVLGVPNIKAVSGGEYHSMGIDNNDAVLAWGDNESGQLGLGYIDSSIHYIPEQVIVLDNIIAIASGHRHSIALWDDGTVWTWGENENGQLGNGGTADSHTPLQVHGLLDGKYVIAIAAGDYHSMALTDDGKVYTWGENYIGQLGDGTVDDVIEPYGKTLPVQVQGLPSDKVVMAIAAGHRHSVAVTSDGHVWTWGWNYFGQLGWGSYNNDPHPVPAEIPDFANIQTVAGGMYHTLALTDDNKVYAWGYNDDGELGDGNSGDSITPVQVLGKGGVGFLSSVTHITAGAYHNVALQSGGAIYTWGYNGEGQLGDGTDINRSTPVDVAW